MVRTESRNKKILINNEQFFVTELFYNELLCHSNLFQMKSKGEKHSVSKVKKLNSVDVEQLESCNEFIESVVTENRLNQGLTFLKENGFEISNKNLGDFIRWMVVDILKEESDTILENNLDEKRIKTLIATKCRVWFLNNLDL